jgi:non-lysosomal glucosylceramidase
MNLSGRQVLLIGQPYCNSHYSRQLILWAIPLAISGQQYSESDGTLSFDPVDSAPAELPFMLPGFAGILKLTDGKNDYLQVISGEIYLHKPITIRSGLKKVIILEK